MTPEESVLHRMNGRSVGIEMARNLPADKKGVNIADRRSAVVHSVQASQIET